jgi:hypothetical protein
MNRFIPLCFFVGSVAANAANLDRIDYAGSWVSSHPVTRGEITKLNIAPDLSATYIRDFKDAEDQTLKSKPGDFAVSEDLVIIKFRNPAGDLRYKLVLSGWKLPNGKMIFGTMYMYQENKLFNGLPISFRPE